MIRNTLVIGAAFAAITATAAPAAAQQDAQQDAPVRSTTRGPSLGIHGSSTALTLIEDRSTALGGGLGIVVGYGLSDRLAIHAVTSGAYIWPSDRDRYLLSHVDVEGRYNFGGRVSAWVPHLALGVSGRTGQFDAPESQGGGRVERTNIGLTAGGGVRYHLSSAAALDWSLRYTFGNFSQTRCPDSAEAVRSCATSTRTNFGVVWYPRAR